MYTTEPTGSISILEFLRACKYLNQPASKLAYYTKDSYIYAVMCPNNGQHYLVKTDAYTYIKDLRGRCTV